MKHFNVDAICVDVLHPKDKALYFCFFFLCFRLHKKGPAYGELDF